jgi:hypothetical protein
MLSYRTAGSIAQTRWLHEVRKGGHAPAHHELDALMNKLMKNRPAPTESSLALKRSRGLCLLLFRARSGRLFERAGSRDSIATHLLP